MTTRNDTPEATLRSDPHWTPCGPSPDVEDNPAGWMIYRQSGPLNFHRLTPELIDVRDIVAGLGAINRFNGQTIVPISVLWHSIMVSKLCEATGTPAMLEGLMHDAGEAYIGDWIRPLNDVMGPGLKALRAKIQGTCFAAAGLPDTGNTLSPAVKKADEMTLRYELQAPWGHGRTVTWHNAPTNEERRRIEAAIDKLGVPSRDENARLHLETIFARTAYELAPSGTPVAETARRYLEDHQHI